MKNISRVLALMLAAVIILSGCAGGGADMTAEEFSAKMEADGYTVRDVSSQFEEYSHILSVIFAVGEDYEVRFFVMNSPENARAMLDGNRNSVLGNNNTSPVSAEDDVFSGTYSGTYYHIVKKGSTMLYVSADEEYRNSVKETVKNLGY